MLSTLRERFAGYLSAHRVGVIGTSASGVWSMPVRYRSDGLQVDCLLPRWADVAFQIERDPRVLLLVLDDLSDADCWLEYRAIAGETDTITQARLLAEVSPRLTPAVLPRELYRVFRLTPTRIDLIDVRRGWGARDTLDGCIEESPETGEG